MHSSASRHTLSHLRCFISNPALIQSSTHSCEAEKAACCCTWALLRAVWCCNYMWVKDPVTEEYSRKINPTLAGHYLVCAVQITSSHRTAWESFCGILGPAGVSPITAEAEVCAWNAEGGKIYFEEMPLHGYLQTVHKHWGSLFLPTPVPHSLSLRRQQQILLLLSLNCFIHIRHSQGGISVHELLVWAWSSASLASHALKRGAISFVLLFLSLTKPITFRS